MKELHEIVINKITQIINEGFIEKVITEEIQKTIAHGIEKSIRTYGKLGEIIEKKIEDSLQCCGHDIKFPSYNLFVAQIAEEKFIQVLQENVATHLSQLIDKIIKPVERECKISELMNQIYELWGDAAREAGRAEIEIKTEFNDDGTAQYVTFIDPESEDETRVSFYNFKCNNGKWHIGYINENGDTISGKASNIAKTHISDLAKILYKYYAMNTQFEMDDEIESIYVAD